MSTYAAQVIGPPGNLQAPLVTTERPPIGAARLSIGGNTGVAHYKLRASCTTAPSGYIEWYNATGDDQGKPACAGTLGETIIVTKTFLGARDVPPVIAGVTTVPTTGGIVTITGGGFSPQLRITSPDFEVGTVTWISRLQATAVIPPGEAGTFTLVATQGSRSSRALVQRSDGAPTTASATAATTNGSSIEVTGSRYTRDASVRIGGVAVPTAWVSATKLRALAPAHALGAESLDVVQANGTSSVVELDYVLPAPRITSLYVTSLPSASAPLAAGENMTVTGIYLTSGVQAEVNGVLYATTTSGPNLTFDAPPLAEGVYSFRLKSPSGSFSDYAELEYVTDPVALTPTKFWEQRGDASDYAPAAGVDWINRVSGAAWVQPTAGTRPPIGTPVDNKAPIEFHATGKYLTCTETLNTMGSGAEIVFCALVFTPSTVYWNPVAFFATPVIFSDTGQYWYLMAGAEDGITYLAMGMYGDAPGQPGGVRAAVTPNAWSMITVRHIDGILYIEANGVPTDNGAPSISTPSGARGKHVENGTVSATGANNTMSCSAVANAPGCYILSIITKRAESDAYLHSIYKYWRLRMFPSAGLPAVTLSRAYTAEVGGSTITMRGFGFRPGIAAKTDGVARTTVWVDETTLLVTVPAHAAGTVSVELTNANGTGTGVVANALEYYSIAALGLTAMADARDFVPATFPAAAVWDQRASAGNSGSKRLLRKASATRNPLAVLRKGKPSVLFEAKSFVDHAAHYFATAGAPTTPVKQTELWSLAAGGSGWMVLRMSPGLNDSTTTDFLNPSPKTFEYSAYGTTLSRTLTGYRMLVTRSTPTYYYTTEVAPTPYDSLVVVQYTLNEATRTVRLRVNKGQWRSVVVPADSGYTMYKAISELIFGIGYEPGASWNAPPSGLLSYNGDADTILSDTTFDKIVDVMESVFIEPAFALDYVNAAPLAGGDVIFKGSFFSKTDVGWSDGAARVTTYVDSSTLIVTVPAHAAGTVSGEVKKADGTSTGVTAGALKYVDLAARTLSAFLVADDYNPAVPAQLPGRASAGTSGDVVYRRDLHLPYIGNGDDTVDPGTRIVNGKKWITSAGSASGVLMNAAGSAGKNRTDVYGTGSWSITVVGTWDSLAGTGSGYANGRSIFGTATAGTGIHIMALADGRVGVVTLNTAGGAYMMAGLPAGSIIAGVPCRIQARFNGTQAQVRKDRGEWTALIAQEVNAGNPLLEMLGKPASGTAFQGALGGVLVEKSFLSDSAMDDVGDALAGLVALAAAP